MSKIKAIFAALSISLILTLGALPTAVNAAPANGTGFTAAVVATSGQKITGDIDATGYDIGIYIGPGIHDVLVKDATVTGANNEGILVQDATDITIKDSTISGNGVNPYSGPGSPLTENKAIVLAGTTNSLVKNNIVEDNMADGGISILDDGPNHPFAPETVSDSPIASRGNVIMGNTIRRNWFACGIVVAAKNPGGGVYDTVVSKNTVLGGWSGVPGDSIPYVGGIVVAGGAFGPVTVADTVVLKNTVDGGLIPGITLHAFGPGTISDTKIIGNILSNNGAGELSENTTGIEIFAIPSVGIITGTQILSDVISNDVYGIWHVGDTPPHVAHLTTDSVLIPIFP